MALSAFLASAGWAAAAADVTLVVNATTVRSGDAVRVTWSGVAEADRANCLLGVWTPGDANTSCVGADFPSAHSQYGGMPNVATYPATYVACVDADPAFGATGGGSYEERLLSMRATSSYVLLADALGYGNQPRTLARSAPISFLDVDAPAHGHIGLVVQGGAAAPGAAPGAAVRVMWQQSRAGAAAGGAADAPRLEWGSASGQYTMQRAARARGYTRGDLCGGPANIEGWVDPGVFLDAQVDGLVAGSAAPVFYRFGSTAGGWSTERSFLPPKPVGPTTKTRFLVALDTGTTMPCASDAIERGVPYNCLYHSGNQGSHKTFKAMTEAPQADAVLHIGDLSYAEGYLHKWDAFLTQIEQLASRTPWQVAQGNHERDWDETGFTGGYGGGDSGGECGVPTKAIFTPDLPFWNDVAKDGSYRADVSGWYSFDSGSAHVLVFNTEMDCGNDTAHGFSGAQFEWMTADLAAVNRTKTPWVIAAGHRPMYFQKGGSAYGPDDYMCADAGAATLQDLFNEHKVDLVIGGHVHDVMVSKPIVDQKVITPSAAGAYDAPVYLTVGNGGHAPVDPGGAVDWAQFVSGEEGWTEIDIVDAGKMSVTLYTVGNTSDARGTVDRQVLYTFDINRAWPRDWGTDRHWRESRRARLAADAGGDKASHADRMREGLRVRERVLGEPDHGARRVALRRAKALGLDFDPTSLVSVADF